MFCLLHSKHKKSKQWKCVLIASNFGILLCDLCLLGYPVQALYIALLCITRFSTSLGFDLVWFSPFYWAGFVVQRERAQQDFKVPYKVPHLVRAISTTRTHYIIQYIEPIHPLKKKPGWVALRREKEVFWAWCKVALTVIFCLFSLSMWVIGCLLNSGLLTYSTNISREWFPTHTLSNGFCYWLPLHTLSLIHIWRCRRS